MYLLYIVFVYIDFLGFDNVSQLSVRIQLKFLHKYQRGMMRLIQYSSCWWYVFLYREAVHTLLAGRTSDPHVDTSTQRKQFIPNLHKYHQLLRIPWLWNALNRINQTVAAEKYQSNSFGKKKEICISLPSLLIGLVFFAPLPHSSRILSSFWHQKGNKPSDSNVLLFICHFTIQLQASFHYWFLWHHKLCFGYLGTITYTQCQQTIMTTCAAVFLILDESTLLVFRASVKEYASAICTSTICLPSTYNYYFAIVPAPC